MHSYVYTYTGARLPICMQKNRWKFAYKCIVMNKIKKYTQLKWMHSYEYLNRSKNKTT